MTIRVPRRYDTPDMPGSRERLSSNWVLAPPEIDSPSGVPSMRILEVLGSGKLSLCLAALLAAVLALSSAGESAMASAAATHSPWAVAILAALAVHLLAAAARCRPVRPREAGMLAAYLALAFLAVGWMWTGLRGIDGIVPVMEGGTANRVELADQVIAVDGVPLLSARTGAAKRLADGTEICVTQHLAHADRHLDVEADGSSDNPAIHYRLGHGASWAEGWLVARDPQLSSSSLGPLTLRFHEVSEAPPADGVPTLFVEVGAREFAIPVGLDVTDATRPLDGTPYRLRIVKTHQHAVVNGKHVVEKPDGPANAAVEFEIVSAAGRESRTAFARVPEFASSHGAPMTGSGVTARYETPDSRAPLVAFYRFRDGSLNLRMQGKNHAVTVGKSMAMPWMNMTITVDKVVDRARAIASGVASAVGPAAVHVALGSGSAWLGLGQQTSLHGHAVAYQQRSAELGFSIGLKKLDRKLPGVASLKDFACDLEIVDAAGSHAASLPAGRPIDQDGYRMWLAQYQPGPGGKAAIAVHVRKDPGLALKYAGTWLLLLSMLWLFYGEPRMGRRAVVAPDVAQATPEIRATVAGALPTAALLLLMGSTALAAPAHGANPHRAIPQVGTFQPPSPVLAPRNVDLEALRRLPIRSGGRVVPFDTFARDAVRRITGAERFEDWDPVELVLSWVVDRAGWVDRAIISVPDAALKRQLGLEVEKQRFSGSALAGLPQLRPLAEAGQRKGASATPAERAAGQVTARLALLAGVMNGGAFVMLPPDAQSGSEWQGAGSANPALSGLLVAWVMAYRAGDSAKLASAVGEFNTAVRQRAGPAYPSRIAIETEVRLNRLHPIRIAALAYLAALILWLLATRVPALRLLAVTVASVGLLANTAAIAARDYLAQGPPVASPYDTLTWAAWAVASLGLGLGSACRARGIAMLSVGLSTVLLALAEALPGLFDPAIRVLPSEFRADFRLWLPLVAVTTSYAVLALAAALGHRRLALPGADAADDRLLGGVLRFGVLLLTAGTLLGGLTADQAISAGDPRTAWAGVALLVYLVLVHGQLFGWLSPRGVAAGAAVAFFATALGWYGINCALEAGWQVSASGSSVALPGVLAGAELLFLLLTAWRRQEDLFQAV